MVRILGEHFARTCGEPRTDVGLGTGEGNGAFFMCWFGTLVAVNLQTSFMTPPFGATLFYLKGTVPPGVTMSDVYRGMWPFVAIQILGLILCLAFPDIILWLPRKAGLLD